MGAVARPLHWIPQDDLLLRNAVEAGASLESLAKGAVQFSQRFTLQELQDRWYSLLYDPDVSEEASAHMTALEHSGLTYQPKINKSESMKRKAESIRKCYYAMRKRICNESFDMINLDLLPEPGNSNFAYGNEPMANPLSNNSGIHRPDCDDISHHSFPEFKCAAESTGNCVFPDFYDGQSLHPEGHVEVLPGFDQSTELPLCSFVEPDGLQSEGNPRQEFGGIPCHNFGGSSSMPQMPIWDAGAEGQNTGDAFLLNEADNTNGSDDLLAELSNVLFDFTDEDELLLMDPDGNDTMDKSYFDGFSSLLLDSPNQTEQQPDIISEVEEGNLVSHPGGHDNKELHYTEPNRVPEAQAPSPVVTLKGCGPEYRNGVICCRLNTEEPEIPSNDDVFLPFLRFPSPSYSSGGHWKLHDTNYLSSSLDNNFPTRKLDGAPAPLGMKKNQKGSSKPSDRGSKLPVEDHRVKFELPKSDIHHVGLRNGRKSECPTLISSANVNTNKFVETKMESGKKVDCKSSGASLDKQHCCDSEFPQGYQNSVSENRSKFDDKGVIPNVILSSAVLKEHTLDPKPIDEPILSDQEELWSENDFDVPYFSDVEAMILDMDLIPDEFDVFTSPEVQQYQDENTMRTIIRLEQAVNACTRRAIAAQGAFAVLYGRRSNHFINKPEVVLGRATEDVQVDIDLGGEKNGGKISRRQASIKMDTHGSFHLENLGKCSIFVNDKEVAREESLTLTSGCLIEVRGLAFVFETKRMGAKQYVDSVK